MPYPYQIIRSARTTLALEINKELKVIVRSPKRLSDKAIAAFVAQHEDWIAKAIAKQKQRLENQPPERSMELTREQQETLRQKAKSYLPERVAIYSQVMGVTPTHITVTGAKTRFGSCSPKNAISFSYYLMLYPAEAIDYVVVHELAHIRHHNHSKAFWAMVAQYMPDYKERQKMLK